MAVKCVMFETFCNCLCNKYRAHRHPASVLHAVGLLVFVQIHSKVRGAECRDGRPGGEHASLGPTV